MTHTATHTPGPWEHKGNRVYRKDSYAIAWIEGQGPQPEWKANGKLIAAAPAMYEALKAMLENEGEKVYSGIGTEHDSEALEAAKQAARAALAQAEGKQ